MTSSPYRFAEEVPFEAVKSPLDLDSQGNRFRSYLTALEMLTMELPDIVEQLENEFGTFVSIDRMKRLMQRVADTSRL